MIENLAVGRWEVNEFDKIVKTYENTAFIPNSLTEITVTPYNGKFYIKSTLNMKRIYGDKEHPDISDRSIVTTEEEMFDILDSIYKYNENVSTSSLDGIMDELKKLDEENTKR